MSTIKISQLPALTVLNSNTSNTLFVGVDVPSDTTGKFTATTLAQGLFSNNALVVGQNPILLTNTVAQFSGTDTNYIQVNLQNFSNIGAGDMVITADVGTDSGGFIDLGINNSQWNAAAYGQTSQFALDGYLVVDGPGANATGNLVIGTANPGTNVVFAVGGQYANNISAKMTANGLVLNTQSYITFSDGTVQLTAVSNTFVSANDAATLTAAKNYANSVVSFQSGTLSNTINIVFNQANAAFAEANAAFAAGNTLSGTVAIVSGVANIALYNSTSGWNLANTAVQNTSTIALSNIIPSTTNTYTLGSATNRWGSVWIAGQGAALHVLDTVTGNDISITVASNVLQFNNSSAIALSNNLIIYANGVISANNIQVTGSLEASNVFTINVPSQVMTMNGTVIMQNSNFASNVSAVRIDASNNGVAAVTTSSGTMLQLSGKDGGYATRMIIDNYNFGNTSAYPLIAGRTARGNSSNPTPVLAGDILIRWGGNGYSNTFGLTGGASIDYLAAENYTDSTKGSTITFNTTQNGTNNRTTTATLNTSLFAVSSNTTTANTIIANTIVFGSATANSMVTQQTNKSTAVTANGISGQITMNNAGLASGAYVTFTVNNSYVQHVNDVPFVAIQNPVTTPNPYLVSVGGVRVGSFDITIINNAGGGSKTDAIVLNWALMRVGS